MTEHSRENDEASTEAHHYAEAESLLEEGLVRGLKDLLMAAQVHATLALCDQLKSDRDRDEPDSASAKTPQIPRRLR